MGEANLFGEAIAQDEARKNAVPAVKPAGKAKLLRAERNQILLMPTDLEALLPEEHVARGMWALVGKLDLTRFLAAIDSREDEAGRPAIDPRILVTLWIYGTSEGVASARELARLCGMHDAYRWICGGVPVCAHTLSDFRVDHKEALDDVMTQVLAALMRHGAVELKRVAQDGTRVRASAGAASFRRKKSLEACMEEARKHVLEVAASADEGLSEVQAAARKRAAQDRLDRIQRAIEELPKAQAAKKSPEEREEARVSTTDPEARVMKMGDGGFRPAWNVQLGSDTRSRIIAGVSVDNRGSDRGDLSPMLAQIQSRTGRTPDEMLADGGYVDHKDIAAVADKGVTVYAPLNRKKNSERDPHLPREGDSPAIAEWRARMATEDAKRIYKDRAATAESINADLKCFRGLDRFMVRTLPKVICVVFWSAIAYNALKLLAIV
jgi:transposase